MTDPTDASRVAAPAEALEGGDGVAPGPARRGGSWLWRGLGAALLSLLLGLGGGLGFVLGTEPGLHALLGLVERVAPGLLRVETASGRLLGRLQLAGVALRLPGVRVDLGAAELHWSPGALLSGRLAVLRLAASDLDLVLSPNPNRKPPDEPLVLPDILLPIAVRLESLSLERFRLFTTGASAPTLVLDRAELAASLVDGRLSLRRLDAALSAPVTLAANARGAARLQQDYPLDLTLGWSLAMAPALALEGEGELGGDLRQLRLRHRLRGTLDADLDARLDGLLEAPRWDADLQLLAVDLPSLLPDAPVAELQAALHSRGDLQRANLTGTLKASSPALAEVGQLAAVLDVTWADQVLEIARLALTEQLSDGRLALQGRLDLGKGEPTFALEGDWQGLRWPLDGDLLARSPSGKLTLSGGLAAFTYQLTAAAEGPDIPAVNLALKGEGSTAATRIASLSLEALEGRIAGEGDVTWSPALDWNLRLTGTGLNPGVLVAGLDDRLTLRLATRGAPADFDFDLTAVSVGPGLPPASLNLVGEGDLAGARFATLRLAALDGEISGQGELGYGESLSWDASLTLSDLNPGSYAPEWPGRISGRLSTQGQLAAGQPQVRALIESLAGELRGYPISASGSLALADGSLSIQGLRAASGPSTLELQGAAAPAAMALRFALRSPDLASLLPDASGRLEASGEISGSAKAPRVTLDLAARELQVAGQGIGELDGQARLALAAPGESPAEFKLQLDGRELAAGGLRWDSLRLRGDGTLPDHRVSLDLRGAPLGVQLQARGALASGGAYAGRLTELELDTAEFGRWRLERAATLDLALPRISAGPFCLRERAGSGGCLSVAQPESGAWQASLDLDQLDFGLVRPWLPDTLSLDGQARLTGRFEGRGGALIGGATAEVPSGRLVMRLAKGQQQTIDFSRTRLALDAAGQGLAATLELPLQALGEIAAELSLPGWNLTNPARAEQPLRGRTRARVTDLARFAALVPQITGLSGAIDADLALGGTLARPGVQGNAGLAGAGFKIPLIGLAVKDLSLQAKAASLDRLEISGGADVGGSRLELSGDARLADGAPTAELVLRGTKLKVADTKEYFVLVSPNIQLATTAAGTRVQGEIQVPEARIRPRSVPAGTVSPSADVVVAERAPRSPYPLALNLTLALGKAVSIDAFGVRGRLAGKLTLLQQPGRDLLGDGQLQVIDGQYRMSGGFGLAAELGAPLTITQGRLVYAKSPIGNPGLLLQAERQGGDTTAGVRVLGTLREPKLAFFSESDPGMTQAEITKYLLTGIPPAANDRTDQAGLAAGTYIAPKLYMEYESGIGDESNKVRLRYDLSPHVELQTETGDSQGADIFFKLER